MLNERTLRELTEALAQNDPPAEEERYPCGHTFSEHRETMGEHRAMLYEELVEAYKRFWGTD